MDKKRQSSDVLQLLKLLDIEMKLGDIEQGDLVFFAPTKMSMYSIRGVVINGPGRYRDRDVPLAWKATDSNTGMFLQTDAWYMRFLIGENTIEFTTKDFGALWMIKKVGS